MSHAFEHRTVNLLAPPEESNKGRVMSRYSYRKRVFLASISSGSDAYIHVEAESSFGGSYRLGNYHLTLADCRRMVYLEFPLTNPRSRQQSLAKAELLATIINQFVQVLRQEAQLIDEFQKCALLEEEPA